MPPMLFSILQIAGSRARKALEAWCSLDYDLLACWERTLLLLVTVKASGSMSMRWREEKPGVEQVTELKKLQLWRFLPLWEVVFLFSSLSFFFFIEKCTGREQRQVGKLTEFGKFTCRVRWGLGVVATISRKEERRTVSGKGTQGGWSDGFRGWTLSTKEVKFSGLA